MIGEITSAILLLYACTAEDKWCTWHRVKLPKGTTQIGCVMNAPVDFVTWQSQPHRGKDGWTIKEWKCRQETQVAWSYTGQ